jgi:hypothetical protein
MSPDPAVCNFDKTPKMRIIPNEQPMMHGHKSNPTKEEHKHEERRMQ